MSYDRIVRLGQFNHVQGHCYTASLPDTLGIGDTITQATRSHAQLFEDGVAIGPPHSQHVRIGQVGAGAYSHWYNTVYFSASDNSDPRSNGREYQLLTAVDIATPSETQRAINVLTKLGNNFAPADAYTAVEECLSILYPQAKLGEDLKLFWTDTGFLDDYQRLCGQNYRSLERKYAMYNLARSVVSSGADVAECGTYNGASAYFLALACKEAGNDQQLYLFDSFQGLSEPGPLDGTFWRSGSLSVAESECRANLKEFRNVRILPGWIPRRFGEVSDRKFCFVHVDVDLYQPTKDSIEFFYPRLRPGGMLLCDDYGFTTCPGATQAMDEFFADKPERIVHCPTGQGLVIKH